MLCMYVWSYSTHTHLESALVPSLGLELREQALGHIDMLCRPVVVGSPAVDPHRVVVGVEVELHLSHTTHGTGHMTQGHRSRGTITHAAGEEVSAS